MNLQEATMKAILNESYIIHRTRFGQKEYVKKYTRTTNLDDASKFNSYEEAEQFLDEHIKKNLGSDLSQEYIDKVKANYTIEEQNIAEGELKLGHLGMTDLDETDKYLIDYVIDTINKEKLNANVSKETVKAILKAAYDNGVDNRLREIAAIIEDTTIKMLSEN